MGNKYMELKRVEEPKGIKEQALQRASSYEWRIIDRESTIMMFTSSSVFLPKYLWKYWSEELKKNDISWQLFLRVIRMCKREIIEWVEGKVLWEELTKVIEKKINSLFSKK
jgi:hypothetical protein